MPKSFWELAEKVAQHLANGESEKIDQWAALWLLVGLYKGETQTSKSLRKFVPFPKVEVLMCQHGISFKDFEGDVCMRDGWQRGQEAQDLFWSLWKSNTDVKRLLHKFVDKKGMTFYISH